MDCNDDIKLVSDHENSKNSHRIRKQVNKTYKQKCVVNFYYLRLPANHDGEVDYYFSAVRLCVHLCVYVSAENILLSRKLLMKN